MWIEAEYSWSQARGMNLDATYDRAYSMRWVHYHSYKSLVECLKIDFQTYIDSDKSRFVFEWFIPPDLFSEIGDWWSKHIQKELAICLWMIWETEVWGVIKHHTWTNKWWITIKFQHNKVRRKIWSTTLLNQELDKVVSEERVYDQDIIVQKINTTINNLYSFDVSPSSKDLIDMRDWVFPYREKTDTVDADKFYSAVVRDISWKVIAWAIIDKKSWESSERITTPEARGKWIMKSLLCVLHAHAINDWYTKTIWCDARYNSSTRVWLSIWMKVDKIDWLWVPIMKNHVTIWDSWKVNKEWLEIDSPDEWNKNKTWIIDPKEWLELKHLRTFVVMSLWKEFYKKDNIKLILNSAKVLPLQPNLLLQAA